MSPTPTRLALVLAFLTMTTSRAVAQDSTVGRPTAVLVEGPREYERAPDFSLAAATRDGASDQWFSLSALRGQVVVLAFYPKDFTSGCTAELTTFTERYAEMFGEGVTLVGISADSIETHIRFAASLNAPFRLLSDVDQKVARAYGSADRNGYNRRTVYVIDRKGRVAYRNLRFGALDPKAYSDLASAIQAAKNAK